MAPVTKTLALAGGLFAASGFATPAKKCAVVWETVTDGAWDIVSLSTGQATAATLQVATTTASEMTLTATVSAHTLQEEDATVSTSVTTPAPTEQATATSVEPVVQAASSFTRSSSTSRSGYNGACSKGSPCTGDITYYDTATTTSNPSSCGTTNDGHTELVLALPHGIMTDSDCGKSVTIAYNGVTKTGIVVDKCMGCDNTSVDLSRAFFQALAGSLDAGRISDVKWYII